MGFFYNLFNKKMTYGVDLASAPQVTTESAPVMKISMAKHAENLNNVLIDMSKTSKVNMTKHTARVALAMDYSGSMEMMFEDGSVDDVVERLLPIALKFDDNGEMESWLFSNSFKQLKPATIHNSDGYVKNVMLKSGMYMGGTSYAPVLKDMVRYYKDKHSSDIPAFIIFITDGDNSDKRDTDSVIRELSNYNVFVQFVGIGSDCSFSYLRSLDNLSGRKHDNTGFISVKDMSKMSDNELYTELLRQYKDWLNNK